MASVVGASVLWNERWMNSPEVVIHIDTNDSLISRSERVWRYVEVEDSRWVVAEKPIFASAGENVSVPIAHHNAVGWTVLDDRPPPRGGALGGSWLLSNGGEVKSAGGWSSRAGVVNALRKELGMSDYVVDVNWQRKNAAQTYGHCTLAVVQEALRTYQPDVFLVEEEIGAGERYWIPSIEAERIVKGVTET